MGSSARFGHDRTGTSALMKELAQRHGFQFLEVGPFKVGEQVVSSSLIRSLIREGRLSEAARLLGRPYSFFGTLVAGSGRGKDLGYPTANLDPHSEVMPPEGVYAAWVRILDCQLIETEPGFGRLQEQVVGDHLQALLNYGRRPTFTRDSRPVPEVHILDFQNRLAHETVEVTVGERLRDERAFQNPEALREQIRSDIEAGRRWFVTHS